MSSCAMSSSRLQTIVEKAFDVWPSSHAQCIAWRSSPRRMCFCIADSTSKTPRLLMVLGIMVRFLLVVFNAPRAA